jgi:hypothetical protein
MLLNRFLHVKPALFSGQARMLKAIDSFQIKLKLIRSIVSLIRAVRGRRYYPSIPSREGGSLCHSDDS